MTPGELWRRVHFLINRSRIERELQDEMDTHRGMRRDAPGRFGNVRGLREASVDEWGWGWWDRLRQDVSFGWRMMRKSPAFTLTAIAVLAIGAGVNIAAFQLLDAVALSPLPVREPESLVRLHRRAPDGVSTTFSYPAVLFYAAHNHTLAATMATTSGDVALEDDSTRETAVQFVSPNYFTELGAVPAAGRLLLSSDEGAPPVIVLSNGLWRARFGADPTVVGRTVRINGRDVEVAGIAREQFYGVTGGAAAAWMPIGAHSYVFPGSDLLTSLDGNGVAFYARLKPGVTATAATADLASVGASLRQAIPKAAWDREFVDVLPAGRFASLGEIGGATAIGGVLTVTVLLAACANLGTLLLARNFGRDREFSIRQSVGASRSRLVRQLMTETVLLAVVGTGAGLVAGSVTTQFVLSSTEAPAFIQPRVDFPVVLFAILVAAAAAVFAGMTPAFQSVRGAPSRRRARSVLVALQVGTGCTLLVLAGLLVRGVDRVLHTPLGFEYASHLTVDPALNTHGVTAAAARAYWRHFETRAHALPSVQDLALVTLPPLGNRAWTQRASHGTIAIHQVQPSYFTTMSIPVLRGRTFSDAEPGVAMVSESFARAMWPREDPLGQTYDSATVVGVVGNAATLSPGNATAMEFYRPLDDTHLAEAVLVVRVHGDPARMVTPLATLARAIDPHAPASIETLAISFDRKLRAPEQASVVMSVLGITALGLGAVGFGGLIAFTVSQRIREIGIRLALGAERVDIVRALMSQFTRPVAAGAIGGFVCAAAVATILRAELFGLNPFDPLSYGAAVVLFVVTGMATAAFPIRRALRVDPVTSLRCE